jgi:hypothetical protein
MSSETSIKREVRLPAPSFEGKPDATGATPGTIGASDTLHPWQFFVLAALVCATVVTYISRGQGATSVVLLSALMGATALVGMAALRTIRPLFSPGDDRTVMIGDRTRVALEREKMLTLRTIKELEFDRAMGKISEADWGEMSIRLRARATRLMRQLDAGSGYREQIERDLATRLGPDAASAAKAGARACSACAIANDPDARFCKSCGQKL